MVLFFISGEKEIWEGHYFPGGCVLEFSSEEVRKCPQLPHRELLEIVGAVGPGIRRLFMLVQISLFAKIIQSFLFCSLTFLFLQSNLGFPDSLICLNI